MMAGKASGHFTLFEAQRIHGWSEPFEHIWRSALGNLSVRALKGMRCARKRWREHTLACRTCWASSSTEQALFTPCVAQLAHYLGDTARSTHSADSVC